MPKAPDGVEKIVGAMVNRALARCEREGIDINDFYRVMCEEQEKRQADTLPDLFNRCFKRLAVGRN